MWVFGQGMRWPAIAPYFSWLPFKVVQTVAYLLTLCGAFIGFRGIYFACPACGKPVRLVRGSQLGKGPLAPSIYTHRHCPWCGVNVLPDLA